MTNKVDTKTRTINLETDDFEQYDNTTKMAIKEYATTPDYYKIVGAKPTDTQQQINTICREKLIHYHPDHINVLLEKMPVDMRANEKKNIEMKYKLIHEAYNVLKNPDKRKAYDLERITTHNRDFNKQKSDFYEFMRLQIVDITEESKAEHQLQYLKETEEMNKKHNYEPSNLKQPCMTKEEIVKKMNEMMTNREMQECEYVASNKFENKPFSMKEFNANWEKQHNKKQKKTKDDNRSIVKWEGIGAANDDGLIDSGGLGVIDKLGQFAPIDSDSESDLVDSDNDSDTELDIHSDTEQKAYTPEEMIQRMRQFNDARKKEILEQEKTTVTDNTYWKNMMENPYNPSAQMGNIYGMETKHTNTAKKTISYDKLEAYKALVYDMQNVNK